MTTDFPFVEIPEKLADAIGRPEAGTRIYRKSGTQEEVGKWFSLLSRVVGPTVSPGGVIMFCPVSRAAVHKRTKEGKLSIFLFHVTKQKKGIFGKTKVIRNAPYGYIPVSEAEAWRREIEERAVQNEEITREELEGTRADMDDEFLQWPDKNERPGLIEGLQMMGFTPKQALQELLKPMLGSPENETPTKKRKGSKP